ncbi:MAG: YggT family protein [Gammaproteobacteria bacterium]|nr:YggT family protein [Gammaproteobacteria bacterium]
MGNSYVSNALVFLVQTFFGFLLLAVMLRLMMQWARASFSNPVAQFVVKATNFMVVPLRRVMPGFFGIDIASWLLLIALQAAELSVIALIFGAHLSLPALLMMVAVHLLDLILTLYKWAIFIYVIMSWVVRDHYNPVQTLLHQLTDPLLRRARGILPPFSGLDLSPIIVVVVLQLLSMLLIAPLSDFARTLG